MASIEDIRAKLKAQQERSETKTSTSDNAMYQFWNTPEDKTSLIRFLPDNDTDNTFFWRERLIIKLPFQGVKGGDDKEVIVQVPCVEMYGDTCPVMAEIRPWWKDPELQDLARKYYKKKSYIFQGFVVESAFKEENTPENPIRRFTINSSIFDIIKASLMNPEMEDLPTDFNNGRDFKLTKTTKGQFANYSTSNWSFKTRPLNVTELEAIEKYGLFDLKEFLPKKPDSVELEVIKEMFHASVNQEAYDVSKWGEYYKPYGLDVRPGEGETRTTVSAFTKKETPAKVETKAAPVEDEPVETAPASSNKAVSAQDILARIAAKRNS